MGGDCEYCVQLARPLQSQAAAIYRLGLSFSMQMTSQLRCNGRPRRCKVACAGAYRMEHLCKKDK